MVVTCFFQCNLPRAVWFTSNPPIHVSNLPHDEDGVQTFLASMINDQTSDDSLIKNSFTLWYIWKARNGKTFNNKSWTVWQVYSAVSVEFQVSKTMGQEVWITHGELLSSQQRGVNNDPAPTLAQP
jgi:hypothetical protein